MLKDVRKSLILWPLTASVIVISMTWLTAVPERLPIGFPKSKLAPSITLGSSVFPSGLDDCLDPPFPIVPVVHNDESLPDPNTSVVERGEHGHRAIRIPDRLSLDRSTGTATPLQHPISHNAILSVPLAAPVRNEAHELAGHESAAKIALLTVQPVASTSSPNDVVPHETILPRNVSVLGKRITRKPITPTPVDSDAPTDNAPISRYAPAKDNAPANNDAPAKSNTDQETRNDDESDRSYPKSNQVTKLSPAGWPVTRSLDQSLADLSTVSKADWVAGWSVNVQNKLEQLRGLPRLGQSEAGQLIEELHELFEDGYAAAEALNDRDLQIRWLYACYGLERRVAVWKPIWELASSHDATKTYVRVHRDFGSSIEDAVAAVREILPETQDTEGWNTYLLLDELERSSRGFAADDSALLAQRFLARLRWHGLHAEHRLWLDNPTIDALAAAVRPLAGGAVDYASLLNQIEHQESNEIDTVSVEIAEAIQTLQHADSPQAVEVANVLNTYYRNANIRIALSERLLQRVLPTIEAKTVPVRTRILGSQVRGNSRVASQLQILLTPSPNTWHIELQTRGDVYTRTVGFKGPVSVLTEGNSQFIASTPIEIHSDGYRKGISSVQANGTNQLRSIESDYDRWPLIGPLVRSIAQSQYDQMKPESNRQSQRQLREQVGNQIDQEVETKLNESSDRLSQMVLGPLGALRLDPQVVDMQTTSQRLLARYRLAGDWQLAAFTPRPRALRDSLMSVQVHQSAMNNMLEQLVPRDHPRSIREMIEQASYLFGRDTASIPDDIPDDVFIQFAPTRPITVEIEEGRMWLTLRIVRLTRGDQMDLRRFIVRGAYVPAVDGLSATLVRDGHLRISGPSLSMRERLPIRTIFNKVLSTTHGFPITTNVLETHEAAQNLEISQMEMREGWLAISLSETEPSRVASRGREMSGEW
ncbi:hypothetical protein Q31b_45260 [Novipirellula aureliae]|uniref:Uncharacterized protein n=1 Tax=Novipirellula aureliae TaxID=2527966 RepID=A0A5C6DPC7_9BACT|nr:hypothetical protein [Novipirellula aureliae]TWU37737.1 hypothetical protein Q31b_45260 [Novipirellula aureliae]